MPPFLLKSIVKSVILWYNLSNLERELTMKPIYIFDLDGTLVDSMPSFAKGILKIADDAGLSYDETLLKTLTPLGYQKSAEYYVNELGVKDTVENIVSRIKQNLVYQYTNNIVTKSGVREYLKRLFDGGARLFVLTASPHLVTDVCLRKNGVYDFFEQVWSVDDFSLNKSDTRLFFKVAETLNCKPEEIHYFDDSLIALDNAKKSGYLTYAVYDAQNEEEVALMKREYDVFVENFDELL